jgi:hypothetical protein
MSPGKASFFVPVLVFCIYFRVVLFQHTDSEEAGFHLETRLGICVFAFNQLVGYQV